MRWGGTGRHTSAEDEGRRGTPTPTMVAKSRNTHSSQGVGATRTPSSIHLRGVKPFLLKLPALLHQGFVTEEFRRKPLPIFHSVATPQPSLQDSWAPFLPALPCLQSGL